MKTDTRGNAHLEAHTEEFLRKRTRMLGGYAFKWVPTIAGVPDRMVLMPGGVIVFVELKQKGHKPTPIQVIWHNRLRSLGHRVYVIDSREGVLEMLAEIVEDSGPQKGKPGPKPTR